MHTFDFARTIHYILSLVPFFFLHLNIQMTSTNEPVSAVNQPPNSFQLNLETLRCFCCYSSLSIYPSLYLCLSPLSLSLSIFFFSFLTLTLTTHKYHYLHIFPVQTRHLSRKNSRKNPFLLLLPPPPPPQPLSIDCTKHK